MPVWAQFESAWGTCSSSGPSGAPSRSWLEHEPPPISPIYTGGITPQRPPKPEGDVFMSLFKSSQELLSGIHEQGAAKKHGACPRSGRCVLVRAMSQQLNGCVGWVYVRGRCAFSDFSLSLSKFIAFVTVWCLPHSVSPTRGARGSAMTREREGQGPHYHSTCCSDRRRGFVFPVSL